MKKKAISKKLAKTRLLPDTEPSVPKLGRELKDDDLAAATGGTRGSGEGTTTMVKGVPVDCLD